jgi:hypothetical protein
MFPFQKSIRRSSVERVIEEFCSNYENLNDFNLVCIPHEFTRITKRNSLFFSFHNQQVTFEPNEVCSALESTSVTGKKFSML